MKKITISLFACIASGAIFGQGIQALDGSSRYFHYATVYDWDCCLFGPGFNDGQPYSYPVDGHYKISYDTAGQGTIAESTGSYASMYPVGTSYNQNFGYSADPTYKSLITDPSCCNALGDKIFVQLSEEVFLSTSESDKDPIVLAYPNPTSDFVTISGAKSKNYSVIDVIGNKVLSGSFKDNKVDVRKLQPGTYYLILDEKAHKFIKK